MFNHLSPKERLGYAGIVGLLLFGAGFVGAQRLRKPAPIIFETPVPQAAPMLAAPKMDVQKPSTAPSPQPVRTSKILAAPGSVSLNHATSTELQTLPGVGPATAQKIVDFRSENQGFHSIEELRHVKGIGVKKLAAMRKYLKL